MVKRLLAGSCLLLGVCLTVVAVAGADPTITIDPPGPIKAGVTYTFTASDANSADSWDLDGDGVADKAGYQVTWAYRQPGPVVVTLYSQSGPVHQQIQVLGAPADFSTFPSAPVVGQPVQFVYTAREATSSIDWDLDADGIFGDVKGSVATKTFTSPGTYAISLQVTDIEDPTPARTTSTQLIKVAPAGALTGQGKQLRLMSPFPVVRITGKVLRGGARIKSLTIQAPYGATVRVRCRGRGCPFRRSSKTLRLVGKVKTPSKTLRIKKLERRLLRAGASIKVLVSRPGEVGKYTRFLIRRGKPPRRTDLCLLPGVTQPTECPSS